MVPIPNPPPSGQDSKDGGRGHFWSQGVVPELGHDFSKVLQLLWTLKALFPICKRVFCN